MHEFNKGDIVQNIFAGRNNPRRYLLYLGKGSCRQGRYSHKTYDCISYDGKKVQLFRENEPLVVIGHMKEFDDFLVALRKLKDMRESED